MAVERANNTYESSSSSYSDGKSYGAESVLSSPQSQYRLIKEIGHGAQGNVFLAERVSDHETVAIKRLNIQSVNHWKQYDLFKREADVLSMVKCEGIAKFYESWERLEDEPPCAYIVQEYIQGKSVQALIKEGRRFEIYTVFDIAFQVLEILDYLHHHDPPVIHRDIKPSNLILVPLMGGGYKVYLIDFGAVCNPQVQGGGSTVAGTFGYMAPEQLMGKSDPESDIYSLGVLIIYLLSGVSPENMQVKDFRLIFEPELESMHPNVVNILRQMIDPAEDTRLADIQKLKTAFHRFRDGTYVLDDIESVTDFDEDDFNHDLMQVSTYGENGNIALLQRLSDQVPRKIPKHYENSFLNSWKIELNDRVINSERDVQLVAVVALMWPLLLAAIGGGVGILIGIVILVVMLYTSALMTLSIYLGIVLIIFFIFFVIYVPINNVIKRKKSESMLGILRNSFDGLYKKSLDEDTIQKCELIKNGRKTIARIVDIQYMQGDSGFVKNNVELSELLDLDISKPDQKDENKEKTDVNSTSYQKARDDVIEKTMDDKAEDTKEEDKSPIFMFIHYGVPTFRVYYSFNPPDDLRKDNLVHYFDTHIEPEGHYSIGDPLPIMYRIERKNGNNVLLPQADGSYDSDQLFDKETVYSMPFPVPVDDPISDSEIIDCSNPYDGRKNMK